MPDDPSQLREWLERIGLEGAEVLAILGNDDLAELDREQLRMLHGLLEARWSIDHPDE
jgi:Icc-related predicted phosphoesterase